MKQKLKSGDECDAITRWRRFLRWRPGQRKRIKRGLNKRLRKEWKDQMIKDQGLEE